MIKRTIMMIAIVFVSATNVFAMTYNEASKADKPILLMVTMTGCGACVQFEPSFNQAAIKFSDKYNFVEENVMKSKIAQKLNVTETPSVYILEPKLKRGKKIKYDCITDKSCFEKVLREYK